MNSVDFKFKIIITGKESVGKTSLIRRYVDDKFSESYVPTLQSDFTTKDIDIKGRRVRLLIYELGGHEKFRVDQERFFKGADYICTVASFDDKESIKKIRELMNVSMSAYESMNVANHIQNLIVINKLDLINQAQNSGIIYKYKVILQKITKGLSTSGFLFTSAKSGNGVDALFGKMARDILLSKT